MPCTQVPLLVQVLASGVVVALVVLSFTVAVAQSYVTVSVQWTWYQKLSVPPPLGTVNVWLTELSPLKAEAEPTIADALPECAVVLVPVAPAVVQPVRPLSKPPLVMPPPPPALVTVTATEALCVAGPSVPGTVTGELPAA